MLDIGRPNGRDESENSFHGVSSRNTNKDAFLKEKAAAQRSIPLSSLEGCKYLISVRTYDISPAIISPTSENKADVPTSKGE